jgi:hypothetical protein
MAANTYKYIAIYTYAEITFLRAEFSLTLAPQKQRGIAHLFRKTA